MSELEFAPELPKLEHSWHPVDLVAAAAAPPEPPTIGGMLYPGKRTLFSGETESLKTWLAMVLTKAELDAGYVVAWADLDAMGKGEVLARLRALGVFDEQIARDFLFYEPDGSLAGLALEEVVAEVAGRGVRLFVVDAFNPMLSLHGLDPSSTPDIETFWREIAQPICNAGAAPTMLDHVVKNADNRGRYAYGSERKSSGCHVHIGFKPLQELTRGGTGRTALATRKDRPGFLPRPELGIFELVSAENGLNVTYSLQPDRSHRGDRFRPTLLMERVSTFLADQAEAVARNVVMKNVPGKDEAVKVAMDVLVEEGYARQTDGPRGAKLLEFVRPYREEEDDGEFDDDTTSSRPLPDLFPNLVSHPSPRPLPSSPLTREEVEVGETTSSRSSSPLLGDEGFDEYLLAAVHAGHVTDREACGMVELHRLVERSRAA